MSSEQQQSSKDIEKVLGKFNWGSAYIGFIWSIANGCFVRWVLESLVVIAVSSLVTYGMLALIEFLKPQWVLVSILDRILTVLISLLILFVYCGIRGNRWAWQAFSDKDINLFVKRQKKWNLIAIILFILSIILLIVQIVTAVLTFKPKTNLPHVSVSKPITVEQCKIMQSILPSALKTVDKTGAWILDLGEQLGAQNSDKLSLVIGKDYDQSIDIYFKADESASDMVTFNIVNKPPCLLREKFCYFEAYTISEDTACMFFYDDKGEIEPSPKTVKFLEDN